MDLRSELPYWTLRNGLLGVYPPIREDISCDVVIVGGGITGALLAYHFVEEGVDTVVIDRRDFGFGSTSASTGLLIYEIDMDLRELIPLVGEEVAVNSYRLCREAVDKIGAIAEKVGDCGFDRKTSLYVASNKGHVVRVEEEGRLRRKHGFKVKALSKSELASRGVSGEAAIESRGSALIDPYRFCHNVLQYCMAKGLRAFDRTAMRTYRSSARRVVVTTDRGPTVKAKKLVLATGYEAQERLKRKVVDLKSTYAMVSEPLPHGLGALGEYALWETARPYLYARSTTDGRIIVGGEDEDFTDPELRDELIGKKTKKLLDKLKTFVPGLSVEAGYSWAGTFGATKDALPYIGTTPEFPNAYLALGYGGNGMTYSIIASEIIRDLYLGRKNPAAAYYRFDR